MPYIKSNDDRRMILRNGEPAVNAGELNYQIFYYIKHQTSDSLKPERVQAFVRQYLGENPNYQRYNDVTGCLIRCGIELKRRLYIEAIFLIDILQSYDNEIAIYEDKKCLENGDVE